MSQEREKRSLSRHRIERQEPANFARAVLDAGGGIEAGEGTGIEADACVGRGLHKETDGRAEVGLMADTEHRARRVAIDLFDDLARVAG